MQCRVALAAVTWLGCSHHRHDAAVRAHNDFSWDSGIGAGSLREHEIHMVTAAAAIIAVMVQARLRANWVASIRPANILSGKTVNSAAAAPFVLRPRDVVTRGVYAGN